MKIKPIYHFYFCTEWYKRNKNEDAQFTEFESLREWDLLIDNSFSNLNMQKIKEKVKKILGANKNE